LLSALSGGALDDVPLDRIETFRAGLAAWLAEHCPPILALDDTAAELSDDLRALLRTALLALAKSVQQ